MNITIGVAVYNGQNYIKKCLLSVIKAIQKTDEILIVNDGSFDNTKEVISEFKKEDRLKIINNGTNKGLGFSRNIILKNSKNDIVFFIDADALIDNASVESVRKFYLAKPEYAAVGGYGEEKILETKYDKWRHLFMKQYQGDRLIEQPEFLSGLCLAVNKKKISLINNFSECYRTNAEDLDLCIRLRKNNLLFCYNPEIKVYHIRQDNFYSITNNLYRHVYWAIQAYKINSNNRQIKYFLAAFKILICRLFYLIKSGKIDLILLHIVMFIVRLAAILQIKKLS